MRFKIVQRIVAGTSILFLICCGASLVFSWSNGGYSANPAAPDYGTHDWIAHHALDWLPAKEKQYITDNLAVYLYGTELPDNWQATDGIGDTPKHHVYYYSNGSLQDDASASRAREEYEKALSYALDGDLVNASKTLGTITHYISDVAVFGHVMGSSTDWGAEDNAIHSNYESYVNGRTNNYTDDFESYLIFDGTLSLVSAYNATLMLAYDTTFDSDGNLNCTWMHQNYNWTNPVFKDRCGESLNLAVNHVADVLHSFYVQVIIPEFPSFILLPFFMLASLLVGLVYRRKNGEVSR